MQRNLSALADRVFDVLVIGGGASGAATAREAALRGFATALIEKEDFGHGASAHCFKVVHGGIRYLQHADIKRLRSSCKERANFLRIAPHLVSPLPFVSPTYGQGKDSKWFLGAGMTVYDMLSADVNRHVLDLSRRIKRTKFLSRDAVLNLFPNIERRRLTGAAIFEDGQMYSPPRLVLGFVQAAAELGAVVANHVEAEALISKNSRIEGVTAIDRLTGDRFDIRAKLVINASGPWAEGVLGTLGKSQPAVGAYSRDTCFVISRKQSVRMALAVQGQKADADALLARNARHLFLVPWRDSTLVGVWHKVVPRSPDTVGLPRDELREFINEFNTVYPTLKISESEVTMAGFGLVPFGEETAQGESTISFGKSSKLIDHAARDGLQGLITLISVRYTVARMDGESAMNLACAHLGRAVADCASDTRALPGGAIENFDAFLHDIENRRIDWLPKEAREALVRNFGTNVDRIFALAEKDVALRNTLPGSSITYAEIAYTVREEMAERMADVMFRRTDLGTAAHPGEPALRALQDFMTRELGWSAQRAAEERKVVDRHLLRYLAIQDNQEKDGSLGWRAYS
jgi:glycerol-3-phosphate dehydrogenase